MSDAHTGALYKNDFQRSSWEIFPECAFPKLKNSALGVVGLYIVHIVFIAVVNMNDMAFDKWFMCLM